MENKENSFQDISLKTVSLLEKFFQNIDKEEEESVEQIATTIGAYVVHSDQREILISLLVLCGIIKAICDDLGLTFEEFQNKVSYPVIMNLLESNYDES